MFEQAFIPLNNVGAHRKVSYLTKTVLLLMHENILSTRNKTETNSKVNAMSF